MALFRGIQEYIALDPNNIALVFDSGDIFLCPPQGHPISHNSLSTESISREHYRDIMSISYNET